MSIRPSTNRTERDRGAALLEFAIAVPIFIGLLLLVFDAGLGYTASRTSSSAARSAARVGALAGEERLADFRVLTALRAELGQSDDVQSIIVYKSDPASNPTGAPPSACLSSSVSDLCNNYDVSILNSLTPEMFATSTDDDGNEICNSGAPDAAWCPLDRRADDGSFLGVFIRSNYDTTTGIEADAFTLEDRAVFAMYFPPEPELLEDG